MPDRPLETRGQTRTGMEPAGDELNVRLEESRRALPDETAERRRLEAALRASEERFQQLADSLPHLVWTARPDGIVDYYNNRANEFAGIRHSAEGWTWEAVLHADDLQPTLDAWNRAVADGSPYEVRHRVLRADGTYRWYLSRGVPFKDAEGCIIRWFGTATDIHQLKQTEEALRASEERFQLAMRATHDVLWDWHLDSNRLDWSSGVAAMFQYEPDQVDGDIEWWRDHVHPDDLARVNETLTRALEDGDETWSETYRFRKGNGDYAIVLDRGYVARDERGAAVRMIGSLMDVTKDEEAREALRQADRAKDEFLAMLAHELRNPLHAISNAAVLLRMYAAENPAAERPLEILERQIRHMTRQVDDLLDVSRMTRGKLSLRPERIDLAEVAANSADTMRASLAASGLDLVLEIPGEPIWMLGDPARLEQVLGNLLNNAGKFTPPGGRVELEACAENGHAVLRVRDTGIGIEPDALSRVFDLFAQEDRTLDRSRGGLGIGLTLVQYLVALHNGEVTAESDGPGTGSLFTIRLPLAADRPETDGVRTDAAYAPETGPHV